MIVCEHDTHMYACHETRRRGEGINKQLESYRDSGKANAARMYACHETQRRGEGLNKQLESYRDSGKANAARIKMQALRN